MTKWRGDAVLLSEQENVVHLWVELPGPLWAAWGSVCSVWSIGRTLERRGMQNKFTQLASAVGTLRKAA